jgi:hypothetical protein
MRQGKLDSMRMILAANSSRNETGSGWLISGIGVARA